MRRTLLYLPVLLIFAAPVAAQELPRVGQVDLVRLRSNCRRLLEALDAAKAPLPAATANELRELLRPKPEEDAVDVAAAIQKLLDPHCLIGVNINPESRVKAVRGPAAPELVADRPVLFLLKLHNDAGSTAALKLDAPQFRAAGADGTERWLEGIVYTAPPLNRTLDGNTLEYIVLRLTARQTGKREATLKFDIGQGTQDLGYRAEVPILFTVRPLR